MQYEVYADLLFLQYFGLNMILLGCLNRRFSHTATWGRILLGAGLGAFCDALGVLQIVPGILARILSFIGNLCMLLAVFPGAFRNAAASLLKEVLVDSFYIGGGFLALRQVLTLLGLPRLLCVFLVLLGGVFLLFAPFGSDRRGDCYRVILKHQGKAVEVLGFVDTGNTLTEPISGKPVAILEADLLEQLLDGNEEGFRIIPYHSIGKAHGILKGYCIEELQIRTDGGSKRISQIYLAAAPEGISLSEKYKREGGAESKHRERIGLLLQPRMLQ